MPKTSAGTNAAILTGDLRFSAGGVRTDDIIGEIDIDQVVAAIRDGSIVLPDATTGLLPDAELEANQGRIAVSGDRVLQSIDHGAVDKEVVFKRYGPTRVVLSGEPARTSQEDNYQGAFNVPPDISAYDASDFLWDRGSQVWLFKQNQNDATWRSFGGPAGFAHGSLYADEATAERHVTEAGKVYVIGQGSGQHVFIVTTYVAATDENWQWDPLGVTLADVQGAVAAHNTATDAHDDIRVEIGTDITAHNTAVTAHNDIRSDVSDAEDRLDALNALEIEPYDSTATYSRGSANSIVTHSGGLFVYISATERSSGHDPDMQPGYWLELSEGVAYEVISTGSHRISARTLVVNGDNDNVYLCTTTQTTPRDLTYIHAQSESVGGAFILLNGAGTGGGFTLRQGATAPASSLGDDGDWYLRTSNGQWYEKASGAWESRYTDMVGQAGGGLAAVSTTTSLTGDGTSTDPLDIADGGVDTANLADDAVTGAKIADDTIHGGALIDGTIPTVKIGDDQVTGAKLSDNAVSTGKVAADAITQAKIADDAVDTDQLADEAVTAAKLAEFAVQTGKIANAQVTTAKLADGAVTSAKLATNAAGEGKVPIDNTLQFDGSGNLGVEISTVIDLLDEDIRYYSDDTTREDARQASKGIVFLDISRYARRIHSVEWDFEGDGVGHNYTTFFVRIDSNDDIDFVYGESETLFNVGTSGTRRFDFDSSGLRIPGGVERLGLFLTRTGSDDTWETKVYRGQPASDSPRESYPDASVDFPFWRSARFASGRPEPGEHIDNYITNGEIYGYPKIRYTLELEHASLVGDGNISAAHISSGSSADGTVLTADGSSGSAFEALPSGLSESEVDARVTAGVLDFAETGNTDDVPVGKIPGGITHIESGATYNNNVITVSTAENVRGGDGILFAVPSPFGTSATQAVSLAITGQANSEFPLHDRNGDALHEDDLTADAVYVAISDAASWDILVLPAGTGSGAGLSNTTPSAHGIGQSGAAGTATEASRSDHVHSIPVGVPLAIGSANGEGTATTAVRSDHVHAGVTSIAAEGAGLSVDQSQGAVTIASSGSWGFQIDTVIVPELNQDAITTARIVLEDAGLTHYLDFLDWTAANLNMISHLPVGAHIGLRQGATTRILRVEAVWDATLARYQVINVNTGILSEAASGTATELLLTAGAGGGTTVAANPTGTDGDDLTRLAIAGTNYNIPGGGSGAITLTPETAADKNFSQTTALGSGQNNRLFDTDITLPTDIPDNELFFIRGSGNIGENMIPITKAHLDDLTAVGPVTWISTGTTGVAADRDGDDRNAYSFPIGQNRGLLIGISNETPYRLQWGCTNTGITVDLQIVTVTAGGGALPGDEQSDNSIAPDGGTFDETTITVPSSTWGFVHFGDIGEFYLGEWHRFLVADLTGRTAASDGAAVSDANSLMFVANEEHYLFLGHNSGGNVLVGTSDDSATPDNVRIRSN